MPTRNRRRAGSRPRPAGFSLVEAMIALSILGMAASALMMSTQVSTQTSEDALDQALAEGIAQIVMDEALGAKYMEAGETHRDTPLGPETGESVWPMHRQFYDDVDDYNWLVAGATDRYGTRLGLEDGQGGNRHPAFQLPATYFDDWYILVRVYYADESDLSLNLSGTNTSDARAVSVLVGKLNTTNWAIKRHVVSYVAAP